MGQSVDEATISPIFPIGLVESRREELESLGVTIKLVASDEKAYLFIEDGCWDWDDLCGILQEMIVETGDLYATIQVSHSNTTMAPDEFGGSAYFITRDGVEVWGTGLWLANKIENFELQVGVRLGDGLVADDEEY